MTNASWPFDWPEPDPLANTEVMELVVEGVHVAVRVDEHGRPLTVSAGAWLGADAERIAKLALAMAEMRVRHAADQFRKAAVDAERTEASTKTKQEKAREHWTNEWLQAAYNDHPDYGAERLALTARRIHAKNKPEPEFEKEREKITEHRARQFLKDKPSK